MVDWEKEFAKANRILDRETRLKKISELESLQEGYKSLEAEALRVIRSSPKWTPGTQRNRPVKVTYTFPAIFQLR